MIQNPEMNDPKFLVEQYILTQDEFFSKESLSRLMDLLGEHHQVESFLKYKDLQLEINKLSEEIDNFDPYADVDFSDSKEVSLVEGEEDFESLDDIYKRVATVEDEEDSEDDFEDIDSMFDGGLTEPSREPEVDDAPDCRKLFKMISSITHPDRIRQTHKNFDNLRNAFVKASEHREDQQTLIVIHATALYWNEHFNKFRTYHTVALKGVVTTEVASFHASNEFGIIDMAKVFKEYGIDAPSFLVKRRVRTLSDTFDKLLGYKEDVLRALKAQLSMLKNQKRP